MLLTSLPHSNSAMLGYFNELSDAQKSLLSGGIAGSTGKTVTAPLSRMTVLLQVGAVQQCPTRGSMHSFLHTANGILKKEGLRAFWKGNLTSVIHRFPYSAINFTLYEKVRDVLCKGRYHIMYIISWPMVTVFLII